MAKPPKRNTHILLVSHSSGIPGPLGIYFEYLKRLYTTHMVSHPLFLTKTLLSHIRIGTEEKTFKIPPAIQFVSEGAYTAYYVRTMQKTPVSFDLAVCFDPLCFLHTYMFRRILRVKKIVYFNLDYSTKRFSNPLLNAVYRRINVFAYWQCDYFFSLTTKFLDDIDPLGTHTKRNYVLTHVVDRSNVRNLRRRTQRFVYAGTLSHSVFFRDLFSALVKLKRAGIAFRFDIYGDGHKKEDLQKDVQRLGLSRVVEFRGIVDSQILVRDILPTYAFAVCPYIMQHQNPTMDHMFHGQDLTAKIVEYIACGLPVVSTPLNNGFEILTSKQFGFLVKDSTDWYNALYTLLTDRKRRARYGRNAKKEAVRFDVHTVLAPIFRTLLS